MLPACRARRYHETDPAAFADLQQRRLAGGRSNRDALYEAMEGVSPLSERHELAIEVEGRFVLPRPSRRRSG